MARRRWSGVPVVGGLMRKALILMCGLGVLTAAWTSFRDSGFMIRESRLGARDSGAKNRDVPGSGLGTRTTSRAELDSVIASNRKRVAADPGNGKAAVELADALMRAARVSG